MYKDPLIQQIENEAIEIFGVEKIGTKELRMAMPREEKERLLEWLISRYLQLGGGMAGFSIRF